MKIQSRITTQLGNVLQICKNGLTVNQNNRLGGLPVTRIETISDGTINLDKVGFGDVALDGNEKWLLKKEDILFSHINSIPHLGKVAIFESDVKLIHGMNLLCMRPDKSVIFPRFLLHVLRSQGFRKQLEKFIKPAVNQASVAISDLKTIDIPLPPEDEQKWIAAILDKADGIRRKRQQAMAMADEFLRSVFLDMFGDPVTNPKGWTTEKVKDIGKVTTGNTPSRSIPEYYGDDIEWIKSDNINTPSHYLTRATEGLSAKGKAVGRTVGKDAILVTCIAGSPDCIGNLALAGREVAFNQQINALETNERVDSLFMYTQLMVGKKLIQKASTNSMKGMVSKGKFELISVMVPPTNLQLEFSKIFRHLMETTQDMAHESEQANILFASISQDAFQGKL